MAVSQKLFKLPTYLNPVHPRSCPDPFVLKFGGEYWCYCTGFWHDGRCFGILRSRNLVDWTELAGAMEPLPGGHTCYWAPEVTYENGRFFMYYSVGNEERMEIRVAVAEHPAGPFTDSGRRLTHEEFAIDAHVFIDDDGSRHLFYATDFLTHTHIGTGTVRDRMLDPFTLEGRPQPVTRARFDWQVYDPQRASKGGVRWHTVEGPFVIKRKGVYYEMFSGGNWQNVSYGVSFAVTDRLDVPGEWEQSCDGQRLLPIIRTVPGQVIGPGHNSAVLGPDNQQWFCVYHRWAEGDAGRVLAIDPLDWAGERMLVLGPSHTPQPVPSAPVFADFFDEEHADRLSEGWNPVSGRWSSAGGEARAQSVDGNDAEANCTVTAGTSFILEVSLSALDSGGSYGLKLRGDGGGSLMVELAPGASVLVIDSTTEREGGSRHELPLPRGFVAEAFHLLRVEVDQHHARVQLDGGSLRWRGSLTGTLDSVSLFASGGEAAFKGFALTAGWEELFDGEGELLRSRGWRTGDSSGAWHVEGQQLRQSDGRAEHVFVTKEMPLASYEVVVNARLLEAGAGDGGYGFYPAAGHDELGPLVVLNRLADGWALGYRDEGEERDFPMPASFDPFVYQQFRFRVMGGQMSVRWETFPLGEVPVSHEATRIGLYAHHAVVGFEMVRVTGLDAQTSEVER